MIDKNRPQFINEYKEKDYESKEIKKLKELLSRIAVELNSSSKSGLPVVNSDCRIDRDQFEKYKVYSPEVIGQAWNDAENRIKQENRDMAIGEQMEMLTTIILYKFLKEKCFVLRGALPDDVNFKADNLVLDKKTGKIVCAFDDVGAIKGERLLVKQREIRKVNIEGVRGHPGPGTRLLFGIEVENGKLVPKKETITAIPLFYIALPPEIIQKGIKSLSVSLEEKSDYEQKIFTFFISLIDSQIKGLNLDYDNLNPEFQNHINEFAETIKTINK